MMPPVTAAVALMAAAMTTAPALCHSHDGGWPRYAEGWRHCGHRYGKRLGIRQ